MRRLRPYARALAGALLVVIILVVLLIVGIVRAAPAEAHTHHGRCARYELADHHRNVTHWGLTVCVDDNPGGGKFGP